MEVNKISPVVSPVFAAVLIVTLAPKVAGPVIVTLLTVVLSVVILPFRVTPAKPVRATVLIPLVVCVPIAPTATVPAAAFRVTSSEEVPSIFSAVIAPLAVSTSKFAPLPSWIFAVLKAIASPLEVKVLAMGPVMMMF